MRVPLLLPLLLLRLRPPRNGTAIPRNGEGSTIMNPNGDGDYSFEMLLTSYHNHDVYHFHDHDR